MENEAISQPLDLLMTEKGVSNADLVSASTEQLTFKMVRKGRKGRPLSLNVQHKILRALLKAKPDLTLTLRDLFRYPAEETASDEEEISSTGLKPPVIAKLIDKTASGRKKKPGVVRTTRKARLDARKRYFKKRR